MPFVRLRSPSAAVVIALLARVAWAQPDAEPPSELVPPAEPSVGGSEPPPLEAPAPSAVDPPQAVAPPPVGSAPASEIIADPELAGIAPVPSASPPPPAPVPNGEARAVLRSRIGRDLVEDSAREEVWEATQIGLVELRVRQSEKLRFAAGLRLRHAFASRASDTPDADTDRHELDVAPTAGYADATLADGLHFRLGYQLVKLGRFETFSATDVLSVYDMRSGPTTVPEAADVAQPAARFDWDAAPALSFRAIYVPFFQPHRVSVFDTDYALARPDEPAFEQAIDDAAALDVVLDQDDVARILREGLTRSGRDRLTQGALSALAPDPDLLEPQAALSTSVHGTAGEASLTLATALERLPALAPSAALLAAVEDATAANRDALRLEPRPVRVEYGRFFVVALDGVTELGPVQLGAEVAYQHDRVYLGAAPGALPLPEPTGVVQLGLRAEHATGDAWLLGVEGFGAYALATPDDPNARWLFVDGERWRWGGAALVAHSLFADRLVLELGGGVVTGPSVVVLPRVELQLVGGVFTELGAVFVEGPVRGGFGDPRASLGGLYDDADLVFLGLGWRP